MANGLMTKITRYFILNEQGRSKLSQSNNSMWITANAGSGKTTNLIFRILNLLLNGYSPEKILCLTYTNAAASEMYDRLFKELGSWTMKSDQDLKKTISNFEVFKGNEARRSSTILKRARRLFAQVLETPGGVKILTIHGFCASILRRFPMEANISPSFSILNEVEKEKVIDETLFQMSVGDEENFVQSIVDLGTRNLVDLAEQFIKHKSVLIKKFDQKRFLELFKISIITLDYAEEWNKLVSTNEPNPFDKIQIRIEFILLAHDLLIVIFMDSGNLKSSLPVSCNL